MTLPVTYSEDQAEAWDAVAELLAGAGVDLLEGTTTPPKEGAKTSVLAIMGKAGLRIKRFARTTPMPLSPFPFPQRCGFMCP